MGIEPVGRPLRLHLLGGLSEGEGLGLREDVGNKVGVMMAQRVDRLVESYEVARNQTGSLVDELVEGVLSIGAGLTPVDRTRVEGDLGAVEANRLAIALHGKLLEVGREALEILLVGEHGDALGTEEVIVPDGEEAEEDGEVLLKRRRAEMLVHRVEAGEQVGKILRPDGNHGGETDGRIHRVAAADPVPEPKHVRGVDAELGDLGSIGGNGHEVLGHGLLIAAKAPEGPVARGVGVGHGLESRECLGGNDEEGLLGAQVPDRLGEVGAVDIGNETEGQRAVGVGAKGLVGHNRSEVGAADADVDDIPDLLAGVPFPLTRADAVGKGTHRLENLVDFGHDIHPVNLDHLSLRGAESDVQDGTVLGDIDLLALEHPVAMLLKADFPGQLNEVLQGRVIDAVFGVVEVEAAGLGGETLATGRVRGEEILDRDLGDARAVRAKGVPGRELGGVGGHGRGKEIGVQKRSVG